MEHAEITIGSLWRKVLLGTEAVYRVTEVDAEHVTVEVVKAPGLVAGALVRLRREALAEMVRMADKNGD